MSETISEFIPELAEQAEFPVASAAVEHRAMSVVRRTVMYGAGIVLAASGMAMEAATPATADTHDTSVATLDKLTAPAHMTAKQEKIWNACAQLRVVNHKGTTSDGGGKGPDVDTKQWLQESVDAGHLWVELDGQTSKNHKTFLYHDASLNAGTNGTGDVWHRSGAYIKNLRTVHGQRVGTQEDLTKIMANNPELKIQYEFKDYGHEWSPSELKDWYDTMDQAGLIDRVNVSSASPRVIKWFGEHHPEVYTELIGFYDKQPNLWLAKQIGADQVNVDYIAAFKAYKGYPTYIAAARHENVGGVDDGDGNPTTTNIAVSVRSKPTGQGDTPRFWLREIMNSYNMRQDGPLSQIVTQNNSHDAICEAVVQEATHS